MGIVRIVLALLFCVLLYLTVRHVYRKALESMSSQFLKHKAPGAGAIRGSETRLSVSAVIKADAGPRIGKKAQGRRFILSASIIAFVSLGWGWAAFLAFEKSGVDIGMALLLSLWVYPFLAALFKLRIRAGIAMWLAFINFGVAALTVLEISSRTVFGLFDVSVGLGAWTYLAASILMIAGISGYSRDEAEALPGDRSVDATKRSEG